MDKNLQWLKQYYILLSLYDIEKELNLPRKTLYKFVTGERDLPDKYESEAIQWIKDFRKGTLNNMIQTNGKILKFSELYNKAKKAYIVRAKRKKIVVLEPNELYCEVKDDLVYLRNEDGLVAIYDHRKERFITDNSKDGFRSL